MACFFAGYMSYTVLILCSSFGSQLKEWRALPQSQPLASMYAKVMGQEIAFVNIDKALVDRAVEVRYVKQY